jgi:hypothetical protein
MPNGARPRQQIVVMEQDVPAIVAEQSRGKTTWWPCVDPKPPAVIDTWDRKESWIVKTRRRVVHYNDLDRMRLLTERPNDLQDVLGSLPVREYHQHRLVIRVHCKPPPVAAAFLQVFVVFLENPPYLPDQPNLLSNLVGEFIDRSLDAPDTSAVSRVAVIVTGKHCSIAEIVPPSPSGSANTLVGVVIVNEGKAERSAMNGAAAELLSGLDRRCPNNRAPFPGEFHTFERGPHVLVLIGLSKPGASITTEPIGMVL